MTDTTFRERAWLSILRVMERIGGSTDDETTNERRTNVAFKNLPLGMNERLFTIATETIWDLGMALLASTVVFWIPNFYLWNINITAVALNVIGAGINGYISAFEEVKYQYFQTYYMYSSTSGASCSVFTTFGNMIEDTYRLLFVGNPLASPVNLLSQCILGFVVYALGRWLALKYKPSAATSLAESLEKLENHDRRLRFHMDHDLEAADANAFTRPRTSSTFRREQKAKVFGNLSSANQEKLNDHLTDQIDKRDRHISPWPKKRHIAILLAIYLVPAANLALTHVIPLHWFIPSTPATNRELVDTFIVSCFWNVTGAFIGKYLGANPARNKVHWGTFRVNILSCILIGTAHNVLLYRHYFPLGETRMFVIVWQRFISDFCGSESSFAGFIADTMTLIRSRSVPVRVAVRNCIYNIATGQSIFLLVVFSVGFITSYR